MHSAPLQWDTYLAEGTRMCEFLIYACGSFLVQWSRELMSMDFQEMIMFLQVRCMLLVNAVAAVA